MNPIRKFNITNVALGVAVFFAANLLAKPPAQNYPEYPQNEGTTTVITTKAAPVKSTQTTTTTTTTQQTTKAMPPPVSSTYTATNTYVAPVATELGSRFDSNLYTIEKTVLSNPGRVGSEYQYRVRVTALANIKEVRITENLPEGLEYVSSTPDVARSGSSLNWGYPSMNKGDVNDTIITVRPNRDGEFVTTTKACVDPVVALGFRAGTPRLGLEKTGPATAEVDSQVAYQLRVSNIGTATADNVVIVDTLPAGLRGTEATPTFTVGNLAAGESRTYTLPVTAVQQGDWVNKATVTSSNANSADAEAPISIRQSHIKVSKVGPDRLFIDRPATYSITVTNDGSTVLENVAVTDDLPKGTSLLSASGQPGTQNNSQVVWTIASLIPGQSQTETVTLTSSEPQTTTNRVVARAARVSDTASAQTIWEGPPGVLTEIVDDVDPIRVGGTVTYTIRVTNQGKFRELNSQVRVIFGDEITPVACTDKSAVIEGKIVSLPDVLLKPSSQLTFKIQAKATSTGLSTTRLEFNSSFLPKPINKDETTYVY